MNKPAVKWMFHASIIVRDYEAALTQLGRLCGARALEFSDMTHDPVIARKGGVVWIGDGGVEFIEPTRPDSGNRKFLERYGPGVYGLAVQVENASSAAQWLERQGVGLFGDPQAGYFFTRPSQTESIYFEWADVASPEWDPHFGAPLPPLPPGAPLIDVRRIAWVGTLVENAERSTARLSELCAFQRLPDAPPETLGRVALSVGDCVLLLTELSQVSGIARLQSPEFAKPRLHLLTLRVPALDTARQTLRRENIRIIHDAPGLILTEPDDTAGQLLGWTDRDLPGDPRGPLR